MLYIPLCEPHLHGQIASYARSDRTIIKSYVRRQNLTNIPYWIWRSAGRTPQLRWSSPECSLAGNPIFTVSGELHLNQCTPQHIKFNNAFVNFCQLISTYVAASCKCGYSSGKVRLFDRASVALLSAYTNVSYSKNYYSDKSQIVKSIL